MISHYENITYAINDSNSVRKCDGEPRRAAEEHLSAILVGDKCHRSCHNFMQIKVYVGL